MSYKITKSEIKRNRIPLKIIAVGYGDLQNLLRYQYPVAHVESKYGWDFDIYHINEYTICTGYRGMVGTWAKDSLVKNYEIYADHLFQQDLDYNEKKERLFKLALEFCKKATMEVMEEHRKKIEEMMRKED